jgi:hypothetical protein
MSRKDLQETAPNIQVFDDAKRDGTIISSENGTAEHRIHQLLMSHHTAG